MKPEDGCGACQDGGLGRREYNLQAPGWATVRLDCRLDVRVIPSGCSTSKNNGCVWSPLPPGWHAPSSSSAQPFRPRPYRGPFDTGLAPGGQESYPHRQWHRQDEDHRANPGIWKPLTIGRVESPGDEQPYETFSSPACPCTPHAPWLSRFIVVMQAKHCDEPDHAALDPSRPVKLPSWIARGVWRAVQRASQHGRRRGHPSDPRCDVP